MLSVGARRTRHYRQFMESGGGCHSCPVLRDLSIGEKFVVETLLFR